IIKCEINEERFPYMGEDLARVIARESDMLHLWKRDRLVDDIRLTGLMATRFLLLRPSSFSYRVRHADARCVEGWLAPLGHLLPSMNLWDGCRRDGCRRSICRPWEPIARQE